MTLALAQGLEKEVEVQDFSLPNIIFARFRYIRDPQYRNKYQGTELRLLLNLEMSRKDLLAAHVRLADEAKVAEEIEEVKPLGLVKYRSKSDCGEQRRGDGSGETSPAKIQSSLACHMPILY